MSRGGLVRRFPVLAIRDFRLLLAERLIAPASVGFSMVGVSRPRSRRRWCSRYWAGWRPTGSRRSG